MASCESHFTPSHPLNVLRVIVCLREEVGIMPEHRLHNSVAEHKAKSHSNANAAVITLSTSRSIDNDQSGDIIQELLVQKGHTVDFRKVIPDNRNILRASLRELIRMKDVNVIITVGGTGLASSDITIETVRAMLEKELPGFNSLFMMLSYPQAKSASMLSRALAGSIKQKLIFCLPGSPRACRLATESLILPELGHMLMVAGS
jgi:molybdenum cofactor biosynthesis protein B